MLGIKTSLFGRHVKEQSAVGSYGDLYTGKNEMIFIRLHLQSVPEFSMKCWCCFYGQLFIITPSKCITRLNCYFKSFITMSELLMCVDEGDSEVEI